MFVRDDVSRLFRTALAALQPGAGAWLWERPGLMACGKQRCVDRSIARLDDEPGSSVGCFVAVPAFTTIQ
jgi:hypothetical protein